MKKSIKILFFLTFLLFLIILYFNKSQNPFSLFQITSGSMMPEIQVGEIVILIRKQEYKENDIITYQVNNSYFVTHRIVKLKEEGYITKGDANNIEDKEIVKKQDVKGKVIFHSKVLGKVFKYKFYIAIILIIFLILL